MHGPASQRNVISVTIGKRFSYQQSVLKTGLEWATRPNLRLSAPAALYASLFFIAFQIRPKFSTVYAAHIRSMAIWGISY